MGKGQLTEHLFNASMRGPKIPENLGFFGSAFQFLSTTIVTACLGRQDRTKNAFHSHIVAVLFRADDAASRCSIGGWTVECACPRRSLMTFFAD